jgi:hypothetical protein
VKQKPIQPSPKFTINGRSRAVGRRALAVAGTVTLSMAMIGTPAYANYEQYSSDQHYKLELPGGLGYVNKARTRVGACDKKADNRGVTTWYGTDNGTGGVVGDYNGSQAGCGEEGPDHGGRITHFHVCVGTECTGERWIP